jgi:hypothetical protein
MHGFTLVACEITASERLPIPLPSRCQRFCRSKIFPFRNSSRSTHYAMVLASVILLVLCMGRRCYHFRLAVFFVVSFHLSDVQTYWDADLSEAAPSLVVEPNRVFKYSLSVTVRDVAVRWARLFYCMLPQRRTSITHVICFPGRFLMHLKSSSTRGYSTYPSLFLFGGS